MKVVLAGSRIVKSGGGIASYNRELANMLIRNNCELRLVTSGIDDKCDDVFCGVPIFQTKLPDKVKDEIGIARGMYEWIVDFNPDVIISSDNIYVTSLFPCFSKDRITISISHFYEGTIPKAASVQNKYADWIVALSDIGKEKLVSYGCDPDQVVVVYNAVDDVEEDWDNYIKDKSLANELKIVYPGGSSPYKSPKTISKLASFLSKKEDFQWRLIWLGSARRFEKLVSEKVGSKVLFTGLVERVNAQQFIKDAHCFVLPSKNEGCPMALLEAMRYGTIPIVSNCPSAMREIVNHGISGFVVDRKDYKGIANCLRQVANDTDLRQNMMFESRQVYLKSLNSKVWEKSMLDIMSTNRKRLFPDVESFDETKVLRWHRRPGRWFHPNVNYLRNKMGLPNLSPILR